MASSSLIADVKTVLSNGPSTTTKTNAIAAAGPIMDYPGNVGLVLIRFQEADILLNAIKGITDAGDGNLTNINAVLAALEGTGGPSTALLANLATVIAAGPTTLTAAKAINPNGPIMDYLGNLRLVAAKLQESLVALGGVSGAPKGIIDVTATGDDNTNKLLLQGITAVLV